MFIPTLLALLAPSELPATVRPDPQAEPVRIWISGSRTFRPGEAAKVQIETGRPGHLLVLQLDPAGRVRVLFPVAPSDDPVVQANRRYEIRRPAEGGSFIAAEGGVGLVYAALAEDPFRLDGLTTPEGEWSGSAFQIPRETETPEADLTAAVQAVVSDRGFDYDVLDYQVAGRIAQHVDVPAWWSPMYGDSDDCMGCGVWTDQVYISVGLGFGWGWPYYYNPYSWGYGYAYYPGYYPPYYPGYYPPYYPGYYPPYYPGGYYPGGYIKGRPRGYEVGTYGAEPRARDGASGTNASAGRPTAPARRARPNPRTPDGSSVQGQSGRSTGGKQPSAGGQSSGGSGKTGGSTGGSGSSGGNRARPRSGRPPTAESRIAVDPWIERERPAADNRGWIRVDDATVPARPEGYRPVSGGEAAGARARGVEVTRIAGGGTRALPEARRAASNKAPTFAGTGTPRSRGGELRAVGSSGGSRPAGGSVARPSVSGKGSGGSVSRPSSGGGVSRPAPSGGGNRPSGGGGSRPRGGRP
jgi:hypothetical protein